MSYNRLPSLPPALPRSLWVIRAAGNHLRLLDKNDTAYHWNLRALDLSGNVLERVVFINNTLPGLRALNLSHNRFWTVPTNMPHNLESIDLSHNYLVQILPGSLDRLPRLAQFYLHANRFSWLHQGVFDKLTGLAFMTLGENPWACEEEENITRLLRWATQTPATVTGCPCYTRPVCGPADGRRQRHSPRLPARTTEAASTYQPDAFQTRGENVSGENVLIVWTSSPGSVASSTRASTTKSPRRGNAWRKNHGVACESGQTLTLFVIAAAFTSL